MTVSILLADDQAMIRRGLNNAGIAAALVVSPSAVGTHVDRLLADVGLRDRAEAVRRAYEHGLVRPRDLRPPADGA
ncbi:response regulator transcription factor [Planomonospora sp. ID82291]|uniref:response regulator transcription factor n=1 Tax=Planomonospora sp. ID82291 TaxID=2738136 RepID=UPI0018C3B342|nr:LuxR C-terminal-related transcriptional regulator [Planomonospora sp. ID82291]MBG0815649.1 response regulator transcription factor [Planomonospora sp. ID82291]